MSNRQYPANLVDLWKAYAAGDEAIGGDRRKGIYGHSYLTISDKCRTRDQLTVGGKISQLETTDLLKPQAVLDEMLRLPHVNSLERVNFIYRVQRSCEWAVKKGYLQVNPFKQMWLHQLDLVHRELALFSTLTRTQTKNIPCVNWSDLAIDFTVKGSSYILNGSGVPISRKHYRRECCRYGERFNSLMTLPGGCLFLKRVLSTDAKILQTRWVRYNKEYLSAIKRDTSFTFDASDAVLTTEQIQCLRAGIKLFQPNSKGN